ncbi:MAG: cell division protein FtsA [Pseudomonadota bacterium]|nr:cell division protein FtsA [Pseudomonadota bacterium]
MSNSDKNKAIIVGLDVGTTKILCLVADYDDDGDLRIIGMGESPCDGLERGVISEIETTVSSIRRAVSLARGNSGFAVKSVTTGIAGSHIQCFSGNAAINIVNDEVTEDDKETVIQNAQNIQIPSDQEILHVIPQYYTIDGQLGIREPIGMAGARLEVNVHIITSSSTAKKNLTKCIENSLLEIDHFVLEPVASSFSVLSEEERSLGVCLVDIGGGTTDVAVFTDGGIKHTAVIPIAGQMITNDIKIGLRTSTDAAEEIKIQHGSLTNKPEDEEKMILIPSISEKPDTEIRKTGLTHIISCRIDEIFERIGEEIENSGYSNKIRSGIVFTGGGARLSGLDEYAEEKFSCPARIGAPADIKGIGNVTGKTRCSTAVGLLLYRESKLEDFPDIDRSDNPILVFLHKFWARLSTYFQKEL